MNIPNYEKCVKYALEMKSLAGESFKDTDLRVYERHMANSATVFTVLKKGGIFIPVVEASLFGDYPDGVTVTVVVKADPSESTVELFDPMSDKIIACRTTTPGPWNARARAGHTAQSAMTKSWKLPTWCPMPSYLKVKSSTTVSWPRTP